MNEAKPWYTSRIVWVMGGQFVVCVLLSIQDLLSSGKLNWTTGIGAAIGAVVTSLRLGMPDLFTNAKLFDSGPGQMPPPSGNS